MEADVIDKLGVTGSSPVPPIVLEAHLLQLSRVRA
jgi:hypothetical protein